MLRLRSYHAAARLLQQQQHHATPTTDPFTHSNKFISLDQEVITLQNASAGEPRDGADAWPAELQTFAVKDNIATADLPTTCASAGLRTYKSPFEATVVTLLRAAGANVIGKTNLDEFGMGSHSLNSSFGPTSRAAGGKEPRSVGGSSGGSAIAVASRLAKFALGTDTGGSVRLPAAYTGVVGFKPSYGLISRRGVVAYANSLDTVGILAPNTKHLPRILETLRQHDPLDPTSVTDVTWDRIKNATKLGKDLSKVTIGVPVEYNIDELDDAVRTGWQSALSILKESGCRVVPISLPNTQHALSAYYVLAPAEAASNLAKYDGVRYGTRESGRDGAGDVLYSNTRGAGFGDEVKRRILLGSYSLSASAIDNYFLQAQRVRRLVQRDFDRVFKQQNPLHSNDQFDITDLHESIPLENKLGPTQVDFIVCPTAPTTPPTIKSVLEQSSIDSYMNDVFTVPASLAGLPAISIPAQNRGDRKSTVGLQIIGQYGTDFEVLSLSQRLEKLIETFLQAASSDEVSFKPTKMKKQVVDNVLPSELP